MGKPVPRRFRNPGWIHRDPRSTRVDKHLRLAADLTGDGAADLIGFGNDAVWVCLNDGRGSFGAVRQAVADFGYNGGWRVERHPRFVADLNGDGKADVVGFGNAGVCQSLNLGDGTGRF